MSSDQHIAQDLEVTVLLVFHLCDTLKAMIFRAKCVYQPMGTDVRECVDH